MKNYKVSDGECIIQETKKIIGKIDNEDCDKITRVVIPNSVVIIDKDAFAYCSKLTDVVIPNSVVEIGDFAFGGCEELSNIIMSNSVVDINNYAFYNCQCLNESVIPESVVRIGRSAFEDCPNLKNIILPKTVEIIENNPFKHCDLTSIIVDKGNNFYDSRENCNAIIETETNKLIVGCKNSTIPTSVVEICNNAFFYCTDLKNIVIPNSVVEIGDFAFYNCIGLTEINMPDAVVTIGFAAFSFCIQLSEVYIPKSVTQVGSRAFSNCNLVKISVSEDNEVYDSRNNCNAIIETNSNTLIAGCLNTIIPENIKIIGKGAFEGCPIVNIVIPKSVKEMQADSFYRCINLKHVTLLNIDTKFPKNAFKYCNTIESINVPKGSAEFYKKQLSKRLQNFVKEF